MATSASFQSPSLHGLVNYLFTRREAILNNWRTICEQDPALGKVSLLNREEFNNLIPIILDILENRLLDKIPEADLLQTAQGHGLHRWHKTLGLVDTMRELNYLTRVLYGELELFAQLFPDVDKALLMHVHSQIVMIMQETVDGSLQKYDELQRLQASSRAATLQQVVEQMQQLSTARIEMLRTSSHDLRGSFGIISSTATLLRMEGNTPEEQEQYLDMLTRSLTNVNAMLTGLMDLSRLEAGQETLHIESFNAAQILNDLVTGAQPMAGEKNIVLRADGPDTLMVKTDRVKLQRIIQNILINALKYTAVVAERPAIVSVSWSTEGDFRWVFSIQDSGPGMPDNLSGIYGEQLRPTVEPTGIMGPDVAEPVAVLPNDIPSIPSATELNNLTNHSIKSEGVGLQIVKRLCELLDANLDVESKKGRGTLFRVRQPIHHTA